MSSVDVSGVVSAPLVSRADDTVGDFDMGDICGGDDVQQPAAQSIRPQDTRHGRVTQRCAH
jgi:hypothetical protein